MAIPTSYIARNGETWDSVAYNCYGDGHELLFPIILKANSAYKDYLSFEGGEVLTIPKTNEIPYLDVDMPYGQSVQISVIDTPWTV